MGKRNNKNIFKNTFRRHSNGVLYGIIFLLVVLIAAGAIIMSNINSSKVDEDATTVTTKAHTTKRNKTEKNVEKKTEEATTEEETTVEETTSAGKLKVTTETLNIRSKPSESGELVEQAEYDQELEIIKKEGDWYKIRYNGITGYVKGDLVEEIE